MKVIHFPSTVGTTWALAQGQKRLGLKSVVLHDSPSWYQRPCDIRIERCGNRLQHEARKAQIAYKISKEFDVFHLNYGRSLFDLPRLHLDYMDLLLYKGKKVCVTYNGCDARQKYRRMEQTKISACHVPDCYGGICMNGRLDKQRARRINKLQKRNVVMFAVSPDLLNFLPGNATFLPVAIEESKIARKESYQIKDKIKIIHAPTQRATKGTEDILKAVEQIEKVYPGSMELKLIENMKHEEAMKLYREADLAIDQILGGWYGGFAMEAMCMGIPTIAYVNEDDLHFIPPAMAKDCLETIINANKNTLFAVLENIINNPQILYERHEASMEYVHRWHAAEHVASITKQKYES